MKIHEGFKMPELYNSNSQKNLPNQVATVFMWIKTIRKHVV